MKQIFTLLLFSFCFLFSNAHPDSLPKGYFINPLAIAPSLSGNFGELRSNHYHMGLDYRTNRVENLPVKAAADGYVARIKIEPYGYGRAIYINHPNGYSTVYAHLNTFYDVLEAEIKLQQYAKESWAIDLSFEPDQFPVKKGQFIANSGNTGGSMGPHLHFEVRETATETNINPILAGLSIPDKTAPTIQRLAIYNRAVSTYEQTPKIIPVKKVGALYNTVPAIVTVNTPVVSVGVTSFDTQTGSANLNGIFGARLWHNQKLVLEFKMDKISYNHTRYLNAHIDYKTKANKGPYIQHLSVLPGHQNSIYTEHDGNGVLDLSDGAIHEIKIETRDAAGNKSTLASKIQYKPASLTIAAQPGKMAYPKMVNVDEAEDYRYYVGENALYDSVAIAYTRSLSSFPQVVSATHTIGRTFIPLHEAMQVSILPNRPLSPEDMDKIVMQRVAGDSRQIVKPKWQNGWATASFRDFGSFQLLLDETPPEIKPVGWLNNADLSKASRIAISVSDNLESIASFRAELNGKWIRFTNDKRRNHIYIFDEQCPVSSGTNTLKVTARDEAGNTAIQIFTFTR